MTYTTRVMRADIDPDGTVTTILFLDSGHEPQCQPNPEYPNGIALVDMSDGAKRTCTIELPYPAPRCGVLVVDCERCGLRSGLTVAGRPDDPRAVKMGCRLQ